MDMIRDRSQLRDYSVIYATIRLNADGGRVKTSSKSC